MTELTVWHISIAFSILWAVCCRFNLMDKSTKTSVKAFYFVVGMIIAYSLKLPSTPAIVFLLFVIWMALIIDSKNWLHHQPMYVVDQNKRRLFA